MINDLLNRAISAMNKAGFEVIEFSSKYRQRVTPLKLKVMPVDDVPGDLGYKPGKANTAEKGNRAPGETRDLTRYLGASDWRHAFKAVQDYIRTAPAEAVENFNFGDFIRVSFDVPAASYDGLDFPARHIESKVQLVEVTENGKALFNFEDIIFRSAINAKDTNKGGFSESALAKYLNTDFLNAMDISDLLLENNDGLEITLPTATELFGDGEYWEPESNFYDEPFQLSFFSQIKNRIKVWEDDTHWYWTSSASASSAANFCTCSHYGHSYYYGASEVGGVAPGFCVA